MAEVTGSTGSATERPQPGLVVVPDPPPSTRPEARAARRPADAPVAATGPASRALRAVYVEVVLRALRLVFAPTEVRGAEQVAALQSSAVFAANHTSHADTMTVLLAVPRARRRRMLVAAAADYWFSHRATAAFTRTVMGAIPVDRTKVNRRTLDLCHDLLTRGWSLLVYPEGGRSPDGSIQAFKPGAAWIARRAGVPVVPVLITGTDTVMPKGRSLPRRARVTVTFGTPLVLRADEDAKSFNARLESAVRALAD